MRVIILAIVVVVPLMFTALGGTLDRQALNAMIRTLRKARDAAYGADA
jgi:hypothetical protein